MQLYFFTVRQVEGFIKISLGIIDMSDRDQPTGNKQPRGINMPDIVEKESLRSSIEIEAERFIEEKSSDVITSGVVTGLIAYILGSVLAFIFKIDLTLGFILAAAAPIIIYYASRVIYIRTTERKRVLRFMLMDVGIQI